MYVYILRLPTFHEYCMHIICIFVIYRDYSWFFLPENIQNFAFLPHTLLAGIFVTSSWVAIQNFRWLCRVLRKDDIYQTKKMLFLPIVGVFRCG